MAAVGRSRSLSRSQRQVLLHLADAGSIAGASDRLHLSRRTVDRHLEDIRAKLGVRTTAQCLLWALRGGLWDGLTVTPVPTVPRGDEPEFRDPPIEVPLSTGGRVPRQAVVWRTPAGRAETWQVGWAHDGLWLTFAALGPQRADHDTYLALSFACCRQWGPLEHSLSADRPHSLHLVGAPGPGGWSGYDYHNRDSGVPPTRPLRVPQPVGTQRASWLCDGGIAYRFRIGLWLLPFLPSGHLALVVRAGQQGHTAACALYPHAELGAPAPPGRLYLSPFADGTTLAVPARRLTPRELDVLRLLGELGTTGAIAAQLGCSARTVEEHLAHLRGKLDGRSTLECVVWGWRAGVVA